MGERQETCGNHKTGIGKEEAWIKGENLAIKNHRKLDAVTSFVAKSLTSTFLVPYMARSALEG